MFVFGKYQFEIVSSLKYLGFTINKTADKVEEEIPNFKLLFCQLLLTSDYQLPKLK